MAHHPISAVFREKERIGKLSQIRELVFGAQDGLLVPLGVISSVAGAFNNNHIVIIAGVSEALAGAFSMATGAYLSSQAERQVYEAEIVKETDEIHRDLGKEKEELKMILEKDGMGARDAQTIADIMAKNVKTFIRTMINLELGIDPDPAGSPITDAMFVGLSYFLSAMVPLAPYFFETGQPAILTSITLTLIALFGIGVLKAKVAHLSTMKSGLEVLAIGAGAGIGGYFLGTLLPKIFHLE